MRKEEKENNDAAFKQTKLLCQPTSSDKRESISHLNLETRFLHCAKIKKKKKSSPFARRCGLNSVHGTVEAVAKGRSARVFTAADQVDALRRGGELHRNKTLIQRFV
jgi:hypothetical protein